MDLTSAFSADAPFEFTLAEIVEMESVHRKLGNESTNQEFCGNLAANFSSSSSRKGRAAVTPSQVQSWFEDKQKRIKAEKPPSPPSDVSDDLLNVNFLGDAHYSLQKRKGKISDLSELAFEAKSARDDAWYDVASFLTFRYLYTGELEVRCRFSGFDKDDDEWVNVRRCVRKRSIPLIPSECHKVKIGDLVLCFQEREDQAVHVDAHVVDIRRRFHDQRTCKCMFLVHYDDEDTEEMVGLDRICRRPENNDDILKNDSWFEPHSKEDDGLFLDH